MISMFSKQTNQDEIVLGWPQNFQVLSNQINKATQTSRAESFFRTQW